MAREYLGTDPVTGEDLWSEPAPEEIALNAVVTGGPLAGATVGNITLADEADAETSAEPEPVVVVTDAPAAETGTPEEADAEEDEIEQSSAPVHLRGPLPDGFPGKAAFVAAGFTTYAKVRKLYKAGELRTVDHIGEVTEGEVNAVFATEV